MFIDPLNFDVFDRLIVTGLAGTLIPKQKNDIYPSWRPDDSDAMHTVLFQLLLAYVTIDLLNHCNYIDKYIFNIFMLFFSFVFIVDVEIDWCCCRARCCFQQWQKIHIFRSHRRFSGFQHSIASFPAKHRGNLFDR